MCFDLIGQQKCDSISRKDDSIQLQAFWTNFADAVNTRDKDKLSNLCHFPFNCDYCVIDTTKENNRPYIKVTRASFDRSQYKIFFTERLIKEINRRRLPRDIFIFQPNFNTVDKQCHYSFSYIARDENREHPGQQHFFDIEKIKGQFKITSAWTLP